MSPRFAGSLREAWWLVVVLRALYLVLILVTYAHGDPGWSPGTGAALGNRGGLVGAWIADLMLYLFGLSAWWLIVVRVVLDRRGYRRIERRSRDRPSAAARRASVSALVLL